jgi:hypothetical protein
MGLSQALKAGRIGASRRLAVLTEAVRQFAEAHTLLAGKGSILEAAKCFLAENKKVQLKPIKVPALVEKFLALKSLRLARRMSALSRRGRPP